MRKNPGPSEWGKANGPEQGGYLPPIPQRPPLRPTPKTWFLIAGAVILGPVILLIVIGSLLPERTTSTGTALSTTAPTPETVAPSTPSVAPPTPTSTPTPTMNASEASRDWWFDQVGNRIEPAVTALYGYREAAQEGGFENAQLHCWELQDYASARSPHSIVSLPDLDPAVGADLVRAFENGRKDIQVAADKCADFFERNDQLPLSHSILFASGAATQLGKVQTGLLRLQRTAGEASRTECLGATFQYGKLAGLDCSEAIAVLDRVQKTGTTQGARNLGTHDYICYYASFVELREGQSDVICRSKPDGVIAFEAWQR